MSYTIRVNEKAVIVAGSFPVTDLPHIVAIAEEHGFDKVDTRITGMLNVTMVITSDAIADKWLAELEGKATDEG